MSLVDRSLTCRASGQPFLFAAGEQEHVASRAFANELARCPDRRAARTLTYAVGGGHRAYR